VSDASGNFSMFFLSTLEGFKSEFPKLVFEYARLKSNYPKLQKRYLKNLEFFPDF
jgi:hypothetical protein